MVYITDAEIADELRELLSEACDLIEQLAEQQAMKDDFYKEKLKELREAAV